MNPRSLPAGKDFVVDCRSADQWVISVSVVFWFVVAMVRKQSDISDFPTVSLLLGATRSVTGNM